MKQETFIDMEYSCHRKKTKREEFWEIMDEIIPWNEWVIDFRINRRPGKLTQVSDNAIDWERHIEG